MKKHANIRATIWAYQWKQLVRNRMLLFSFAVLAVSAMYSTYYGRDFVQRQRATIAESYAKGTEGRSPYVYFYPTDFAGLAIGQKDNLPFIYPRHNSRQSIYSVSPSDIQNPGKLLAGNFDLSFIIIFLLPLLVIVFGYGLRSEEVEQGTYTLLRVQSDADRMLANKWLFRCVVICVFMTLLNLAAFSVAGIPVAVGWSQKASWLMVTLLYTVFWFTLVWVVVRLRTSGPLAALLLGGVWVVLLLVIPSLVYQRVSDPHAKEQIAMLFNQRGDFPKASELPPSALADSFARLDHPISLPPMDDTSGLDQRTYQIIRTGEIQARFDNSLGRRVLELQAQEYQRTLDYNWFNPVFTVQHAFNQIAGTELNHHHDYLVGLERYHLMQRYTRYRHVLETKSKSAWGDAVEEPDYEYQTPVVGPRQALRLVSPALVLALGFLTIGILRFNE